MAFCSKTLAQMNTLGLNRENAILVWKLWEIDRVCAVVLLDKVPLNEIVLPMISTQINHMLPAPTLLTKQSYMFAIKVTYWEVVR
jgi:hypothetical protein